MVIILLSSLVILFVLYFFKILNCDKKLLTNENIHFNILSTNAIIAGFLFTGLSIIITVMDKERIKRLSENGYLDVFYNTILTGIIIHLISIGFSLLNMLKTLPNAIIITGNLEVCFLIIGLIIFLRSVFYLREIIKIIKSK